MKIACLSGKGGAGKTFTAVNLAASAGKCCYVDCDVEEPNGRLFLKPERVESRSVSTLLPEFDDSLCSGCKKCVDFCRFHALVYVKGKPMVFSEVCHSCGGCALVCPEKAVVEKPRPIGILEAGRHGDVRVITGVLNPGEASGITLIKEAVKSARGLSILDCPPGSACPVMESASAADYCLLVAEPTAFGLHNFKMVHELVHLLGKPCGVLINKQDAPYEPLERFCEEQGIPVLARIPFDPEVAECIASGEIAAEKLPRYRELFQGLLEKIGGSL